MFDSHARAELERATPAWVDSLTTLLRGALGDARVCLQELHAAHRDRDSARMASLVRRLQKEWTKVLTGIRVIELVTGFPAEEARRLLRQSEREAEPLLACVKPRGWGSTSAGNEGETL